MDYIVTITNTNISLPFQCLETPDEICGSRTPEDFKKFFSTFASFQILWRTEQSSENEFTYQENKKQFSTKYNGSRTPFKIWDPGFYGVRSQKTLQ